MQMQLQFQQLGRKTVKADKRGKSLSFVQRAGIEASPRLGGQRYRCSCIYAANNKKLKAVQKQNLLELRPEREREGESYVIMLRSPKGDNMLGVTLHVKEDLKY